jgi:hypothetical protein
MPEEVLLKSIFYERMEILVVLELYSQIVKRKNKGKWEDLRQDGEMDLIVDGISRRA